ncbi:MAG: hypothetical protein IJV07_03630 [Alphaproteobacteria bacterium]|nr:hypothetical protein [Alphaproteobacteria bacterium]
MSDSLNQSIQKLTKLVEQSQNKKLLWEEMQILSKKAFELQDKIMAELDKIEALETDIVKVQSAFSAREGIWDLMRRITDREQEIKARTHHKETPDEREKRHKEVMAEVHEHHCCCGHHHKRGECCESHSENCCHKGHKKCQKK